MNEPDVKQQIDRVVVDLTREFGAAVEPDDVRRHVMISYGQFAGSRITTYVPVLTRRMARESLRRLTHLRRQAP